MRPLPIALASYALANLLLHIALLIPSYILSHSQLASVFLPLILSCHFYTWRRNLGFAAAFHALWSMELLLFRRPREDFKLVHHGAKRSPVVGKKDTNKNNIATWKEPYPDSLAARFWWVTKLSLSFRFVGWVTTDSKFKKESAIVYTTPNLRRNFLLSKALSCVLYFVVTDAVNALQQSDPYVLGLAGIDSPLPKIFGPNTAFIKPRATRLLIFGINQYCVFSLVSSLIAFVCVCLGSVGLVDDFWGGPFPENWPPVFGSPTAIMEKGLRGFWGQFWHQIFRNMFADPGTALYKVMGHYPGSKMAYIIQVVVAFFLSGTLHALTLPLNIPELSPLQYALFFWINGLFVVFEVLMTSTLSNVLFQEKSPGMERVLKVIRLAWVAVVLYFTGPLIADVLVKLNVGFGGSPSVLFSTKIN